MAGNFSNQIVLKREHNLLLHKSSKSENNKHNGDTKAVAAVEGEVDIEKAGSMPDCDDKNEFVRKAEVNEIEFGETSQEDITQQSAELKLLSSDCAQHAGDLAHVAAGTTRYATTCCQIILNFMLNAINIGKRKKDEALQKVEKVNKFDEATRYSVLANKYDAAIKLASKKVHQIEAVIESTENASMEAEIAANQIADISDKTSSKAAEKLSNAYQATNVANMAAVEAHKMEYVAVNAMKKCWPDLNPGFLEIAGCTIKCPKEKHRSSGILQRVVATCRYEIFSFAIGFIFSAFMLVAFLVLYLYTLFACYRNKRREDMQNLERSMMLSRIDKRLQFLEKYFEKYKISSVHLESDNEEE